MKNGRCPTKGCHIICRPVGGEVFDYGDNSTRTFVYYKCPKCGRTWYIPHKGIINEFKDK